MWLLAAGTLTSCGNAYKGMTAVAAQAAPLESLQPVFHSELYRSQVDITGRHLSGLLLIKTMPDSSRRVVFSTETGFKFFDFAFDSTGTFSVIQIMDKLNKKVVISALRNDFDLLLMLRSKYPPDITAMHKGQLYRGFKLGGKTFWYVTPADGTTLDHAELGAKRKILAEAKWFPGNGTAPDSISLVHHNFHFTIDLKKLER
ncbi:hypothetical protein FPE01S_01_10930 [Flavihumibacter petaseus NBRC 106054]|uniref:Outer-membrane lipoprotein LolB n=1 Tax=Flavihumibacter petaseus NBRC 106054 TaxID=1220578 RepID=A0A0E9MY72_9BACT|nr:hypothetical protein FPE01S_01_10930 [Flavihumibacter petaseus NBRC 106054]